ncbi:MAG: hypothetical protein AAFR61_12030 [Bacteroidota bacterium]
MRHHAHLQLFIPSLALIQVTALCLFLPLLTQAQLKPLEVDYQMRGYFYATSAIVDSLAPGGFGGSNNMTTRQDESWKHFTQDLAIFIDTTETNPFSEEIAGYPLYLINGSDTVQAFEAQDSRLAMVGEVWLDEKWQPIEYLPSSWCGNSYHTLYLPSNQYWSFAIPQYKGPIATKLRYRITTETGLELVSNEIETSIHPKQLTTPQSYRPRGLMDPYDN